MKPLVIAQGHWPAPSSSPIRAGSGKRSRCCSLIGHSSFPPMAREIKEAPRETGLAGLRAGSRASMPDGHCRWPSFREGGGETLHHELPISTVRVSDKKSVRVRRCRLGGIWRDFVGPTQVAPKAIRIWPTSGRSLPLTEACLKPVDEQSHPKDERSDPKKVSRHRALRGRHINKKPVLAAKHQGGSGGRRGRATSPFSKKRTATVWSNPFAPFARQNPRAVAHRTPVKLWQNPHFQRG